MKKRLSSTIATVKQSLIDVQINTIHLYKNKTTKQFNKNVKQTS